MAVEVTSTFKPYLYEHGSVRWRVRGYSWIKDMKPKQCVDSPILLKLAGAEIGLSFYPTGVTDEVAAEKNCSIFVYCRGRAEGECIFTLKLLSGSVLTAICKHITCKDSPSYGSYGWPKFTSLEMLAKYIQDDSLLFEFSMTLWSLKAVTCTHDTAANFSTECSANHLATDLGKLLKQQEHCDAWLRFASADCGDGITLPAHRVILAARSPVFKSMLFGSGLKESSPEPEVLINDVSANVAQLFLHAIYTNEIQKEAWEDSELLCYLFAAFHKYQVTELLRRCEERVIEQVSEENVAERLMMSDLMDIPSLRRAALEFMGNSFSRLAKVQATEGFQRLIQQRPKLLAEILAESVPPALPLAKRRRRTIEEE